MSANGIYRKQLSESQVQGRRLGRHVEHDPRSRDFVAAAAPQIVSVKHNATALPLDQGQIGSCTANALCGALDSEPNLNGGTPLAEPDAVKVYELETKLEGQPYPPNDPGGSGLMVCKAAKEMGLISAYHHAFGIEHALKALVLRPVITGVNWYTSFDQPDANGLVAIAPDATVRGGHEIVADEIDAPNQLVWFWNSWGTKFGVGGRFCMSFDTWDQLLKERGDATVPVK
jgi:hypothetical protein